MKNLIRNYKHRLYPNKNQQKTLDEYIFVANQVYNIGLDLLQKEYESYKKSKNTYTWMKDSQLDRRIKFHLEERNLYGPTQVRQGERTILRKAYHDGLDPESNKEPAKFRRSDTLLGAFSWTNFNIKITEK